MISSALAAADRHHRVDGLEARLHGLRDVLAENHAGRDALERRLAGGIGFPGPLAIDRHAERIDHAPEKLRADRHLENTPRGLDAGALGNLLVIAEDNGAHRVLLQVQRETKRVAGELEHLAIACIRESVDTHDAIGDAHHGADVARFRRALELVDARLDQVADFRSLDGHIKPLILLRVVPDGLSANHR